MRVIESKEQQQQSNNLLQDDTKVHISRRAMARILARLYELQRIIDVTHETFHVSRLQPLELTHFIGRKLDLICDIIYFEVFAFRGTGPYHEIWRRYSVDADIHIRKSSVINFHNIFTEVVQDFIDITKIICFAIRGGCSKKE